MTTRRPGAPPASPDSGARPVRSRERRQSPPPALSDLPLEDQRFAVLVLDAMNAVAVEYDLPEQEVRNGVARALWSARLQHRRADELRSELVARLTPSLVELDPVPRATIEQAQRLATLRARLLGEGAYSVAALADARGAKPNAVRQWLHRARGRDEVFTVAHDRETLVPSFLLDDDLRARPEARPPISVLRGAGEDGWALWAWFALPSAALEGRAPAELLGTEPDRVAELARRRAAEAA